METIYSVEGIVHRDFIGQIAYTISLEKTWKKLDIGFSFDRQKFEEEDITPELEESAWIDGASPPVILVRIILPLCTPSLAAIAMFYGIANWNSYMDCLLYTNTPKLQTLQLYLRNMLQQASTLELSMTVAGSKSTDYLNENALRMVTVSVSIIPVLIIYPFLQRYYTKGITIGAVKG